MFLTYNGFVLSLSGRPDRTPIVPVVAVDPEPATDCQSADRPGTPTLHLPTTLTHVMCPGQSIFTSPYHTPDTKTINIGGK